MEQAIAAVATPVGKGGIGIIRISGKGAISIAGKIVQLSRSITDMPGYTCAYGRVYDVDGEIDEAVVTVFRAPHSYTGEDVVEIASHGGVYILNRILRACCDHGARLALAGEFTKRAFLNGKLDLTQAEAVIDLISAQGKQAAKAALSARDGALFQKIDRMASRLTEHAAHLAAWIDYPEEDIVEVDQTMLEQDLRAIASELNTLLATYDSGRLIREGIQVAIVGRPNAGKSTLMNLLTGYNRSIVTDIAGTTRDVVSDTIQLGDLLLHLSDTAGIRQSNDPVEKTGVILALGQIEKAQLVLAVFDGSEQLDENDKQVIAACSDVPCIALINKNDLPQKLDVGDIEQNFPHTLIFSAQRPECLDRLKQEIVTLFDLQNFDSASAIVANERQRLGVEAAAKEVSDAINALMSGVSYDAVCVCVESAIDHLLALTGKRASQEVIDQVFANFCVGK